MSSTYVILIAVAAVVLLGVAAFAILWKVPAADEALIVTGLGSRRIVTGSGALVLPILQKAQYLSLRADSAELHVEGVDKQKIPVGVKGVAILSSTATCARSSAASPSRT
jgi:flotillin